MPSDTNKTTRFEYNLDGNLVKLIAENAETGEQVTEWVYGVTVAQGSKVESKSLVHQKVYPESTGAGDRVSYQYNRQGQATGVADQAGTVHAFAFDKFGRFIEDEASAPTSSAIDMTVKKITRSYEVRGMLETVSSFGTSATPLNQIRLTYNAYAQLSQDAQAHSGAVGSGTLKVQYAYADGAANTVRPTSITYPDGTTTITTAYVSAEADALSRPDALKEGSDTLCSYRYLGGGVVIGVKYDAASNIELTFEDGGTGGDEGDKYTGLDRFGRLVETLWKKGSADRVRSSYGRNRFGGITWRRDDQAHAQTPSVNKEDNYYSYDGLYQVKERQRGNLTGTAPNYTGITNLQQEEDWTYDQTGNWTSYSSPSTVPADSQTRTHNKANEITQIARTSGGATVNPSYDPAGNMLTLPKQPGLSTAQYALKWDAWNRLVQVKDGSTSVARYAYDGLTRRQTKTNAAETRHYYYNDEWRALEESVEGASIAVDRQYTWGLRDRWDLLRRKRSTGGSSLNETHYCLRDYLDPVAIVNTDGEVVERYAYDAFGTARILAPDYTSRSTSDYDWEFLFHAEFLDADTSLYNYGYRYYSPGLGRWLSRDPIEEKGGLNLYSYVSNHTINSTDRLGSIEIPVDRYGRTWMPGTPMLPPPPTPEQLKVELQSKFDNWYEEQKKDMAWNDSLPPCPCNLDAECRSRYVPSNGGSGWGTYTEVYYTVWKNPDPNTWTDPEDPNFWGNFHPGAKRCIRTSAKGSGEQCCYDASGKLITGGAGAGSADRSSPSNGVWNNLTQNSGHQAQDVIPFKWAQELDGGGFGVNTQKYYEARPANNRNHCPENSKP